METKKLKEARKHTHRIMELINRTAHHNYRNGDLCAIQEFDTLAQKVIDIQGSGVLPEEKRHTTECNLWHDFGGITRHINREGFQWKCNCGAEDYNACRNEMTIKLVGLQERIEKALLGKVEIGRGITEKLSAPNETLKRYAKVITQFILGKEYKKYRKPLIWPSRW